MKCRDKLDIALLIIQKELPNKIYSIEREINRPSMKIGFSNGIIVYIRYNDYAEYSYQIIYSQNKNDRLRFDNFDDHWDVPTKPHHTHERGSNAVSASPMVGDPDKDIKILISYIDY